MNIFYYPPDDTLNPLSSESDIRAKLHFLQNNENLDDISRNFTFKKPYCVCHSDKHKSSEMVECKYGKAGCNCRFHPSCMGRLVGDFGPDGIESTRAKRNIGEMGFICPLCSEYIEEMHLRHTYCQYTFLNKKEITTKPDESILVEGQVQFKEYTNPFYCWGILGLDRSCRKKQKRILGTVELDDHLNSQQNDEIVAGYEAPYVPSNVAQVNSRDDEGTSLKLKRTFVNLLNRVRSMAGSSTGPTSASEQKSSHSVFAGCSHFRFGWMCLSDPELF